MSGLAMTMSTATTSSEPCLGESSHVDIDEGSFVNVDISHIIDFQPVEISTSAILHYCKRKILIPYFKLLALLGWRPLYYPATPQDVGMCVKVFNTGYTITVVLLILVGYVLQYAACFRRDGFGSYSKVEAEFKLTSVSPSSLFYDQYSLEANMSFYNHLSFPGESEIQEYCNDNVVSVYLLPAFLHFVSYMYVLYQMRVPEREQLEHLLERVFLQATVTHAWHVAQRKLIRTLRTFLGMGVFWALVSVSPQILHLIAGVKISFTWMDPHSYTLRIVLITLLMVTLMWNDIICVAIATSYSIHCQLIISYLENIDHAVREKRVSFLEFYKEIMEARKFISYLNEDQAVGVSLVILNYGCKTTTVYGFLSGTSSYTSDVFILLSVSVSVFLWIILVAFPVVQAARLTSSCWALKKLGHEIWIRPFGYQDTIQEDLDSVLLFTTSLQMRAKLFRTPVYGSSLILVCRVATLPLEGHTQTEVAQVMIVLQLWSLDCVIHTRPQEKISRSQTRPGSQK
ncbi:uncharacterized protein LOC111088082 isoform X2 [Limulus polyphemus]|uniref:Uncharacterized protein LOC111088082 isoform X2 n=1 Tax=Limulus polyphemus TaxID=6850 RepID=A0ABM1T9Y6_LIMPO|nr:uncharacterized protein LOC111088082 isoform X2 [Limulus polyphemus]